MPNAISVMIPKQELQMIAIAVHEQEQVPFQGILFKDLLCSTRLFSGHRLRDAVADSIGPAIVRGLGNAFLKTENIKAQTALFSALQPLLPFQIIVQVAGWPSHHASPKEC